MTILKLDVFLRESSFVVNQLDPNDRFAAACFNKKQVQNRHLGVKLRKWM